MAYAQINENNKCHQKLEQSYVYFVNNSKNTWSMLIHFIHDAYCWKNTRERSAKQIWNRYVYHLIFYWKIIINLIIFV